MGFRVLTERGASARPNSVSVDGRGHGNRVRWGRSMSPALLTPVFLTFSYNLINFFSSLIFNANILIQMSRSGRFPRDFY